MEQSWVLAHTAVSSDKSNSSSLFLAVLPYGACIVIPLHQLGDIAQPILHVSHTVIQLLNTYQCSGKSCQKQN